MSRHGRRTALAPLLPMMFVSAAVFSAILQGVQLFVFLPSIPSSLRWPSSDVPVFDGDDVPPTNQSFGVCLLSMEDNHLLPEWIAYHYTVLPLRRLIIANDPRSRTSPKEILDRWRDLIEVTEWQDRDIFNLMYRSAIQGQIYNSTADMLTQMHRFRQRFFYFKCMRQMKREGRSYVLLIDSDEFLNGPNPNWRYASLFKQRLARGRLPGSVGEGRARWTILDLLHMLRGHRPSSSPCVSLPRLMFGTKEEISPQTSPHNYNATLLEGLSINASELLTLRWIWHGPLHDIQVNKAGKALVDVAKIPFTSFEIEQSDPHRPVRDYCSQDGVWIKNVNSPLVVHHYVGTFQQWSFRLDPRGVRSVENFEAYSTLNVSQDNSISDWVEAFVAEMGMVRARALLTGAGRIETLLQPKSLILSDEAYDYLKVTNVTANVTRLT